MRFIVEILSIPDEPPRKAKLIETYEVEAKNLEQARIVGLERFKAEHPYRDDWNLIHGKAKPVPN